MENGIWNMPGLSHQAHLECSNRKSQTEEAMALDAFIERECAVRNLLLSNKHHKAPGDCLMSDIKKGKRKIKNKYHSIIAGTVETEGRELLFLSFSA